MTQLSGGISVDCGHRTVEAGSTSSSSTSSVETRASRSSPEAWDEDLGRWGSEPWNMPGQGEKGSRCGEWYPEGVCETCAELHLTTHNCGKRSCPDCWTLWAQKAGVRATQRIQAFRYTQPDDHKRQVAHASVSPPEGDVRNEREYWEGKTRAAEMAKEKGFRGFAVIPHPYRVTEEGNELYRAEDPDYGKWVWLRNEVEDMERYIRWSPHYHIIGLTTADMEPAKESDEWAYTFIRTAERFTGVRDSESHNDLYGMFRYLFSHTGYPEGSTKQVTTWHGDLANNVFVEDATEGWQIGKPSEGIRSVLEREIENVAGVVGDDDDQEGGGGGDELAECDVEDCGGVVIDVFDIDAYLRQSEPPPEVRETMVVARDWRLNRLQPPPGMRHPQTEEQAREVFEVIRE